MNGALPFPTNDFVGRTAELARLRELVAAGHRVVTVWGGGGMGKTRLVAEFVRAVTQRRVAWVDLSRESTLEGALDAVTLALGAEPEERRAAPLAARSAPALSSTPPSLLVLDTAEHLSGAIPALVDALTAPPSTAQVIVTTRHRLTLPREAAIDVGPFPLVSGGRDVLASDAGRLFVARARDARVGLDASSGERIGRILRALDGIPLAIELAAANAEVIGLSGLEARVDERLDLLARNADDRHGTMRSAMGWSWALLDDRERSALLQCAIFRGTFSFDAAEQVVLVERAKLLPTLKSLADKSLVTVVPEQGALPPRLALFQTVREFVFEKLSESGELAACQARLDAYVLTRGRVLRAELERRGAASARVELAHELDNLLDVHERALAKGGKAALETALDALLAAEPVLSLRDPRERTALRWAKLEAAFGTIRGFGGARRAELVGAHGVALGQAHRPGEAEAKLTTAIRLARRSKARRLEGRLELDLGLVLHTYRALARARDAYLAALRLLDEDGAERLVCRAHANLGALLHDEKDFAGAEEHYERAIAMAARLGDLRIEGISLTNRAVLAQEEGDLWRAETALRQAIHLLLGATDDRLVAIARGNLGALLLERGDLARARSELEAALELLSAQGDARSLGIARVRVAMLATLARDDELARTSLLEARAAFLKASSPIDLGLVEIVLIVGDAREFRLSLEDARARIREVLSRKDGDRSLEDARDDARSLGRVAETALRELANSRPREVDQLPNALVVGPDAETFRAPGEGPRYIGDHDAPRKILLCLLDAPDQTRTLADLVAAGWEGQSLHPLSATNRVHVALAYLRKQGLARVIQRIPGGYRIDPSIAVLRVDRPLVARPPSKKSAPRKPASQRPRT